jgi:3-hydroxyisobutyrate dehydrogenase-like beta-hydroxyacid dehydrogenase
VSQVAIVGAGAMGSAVAGRLVASGYEVLTLLDGRSEASRGRAAQAGMKPVSPDVLMRVPLMLSIVPPGQAEAVIDQLSPALARAPVKPLFVDCNALAPDTKRVLADKVIRLGARLVDGAIIGAPPAAGDAGPRLYVSGDGAGEVGRLAAHGLAVRVLDGPLGAAAALKMCYAGINKGLTALTTAMLLAAERSGAGQALAAELAYSQPWLLRRSRGSVPAMYPKAYRWVAEMDEISRFLADDPAAASIYAGAARFFADRAAAQSGGEELRHLQALFDNQGDGHGH